MSQNNCYAGVELTKALNRRIVLIDFIKVILIVVSAVGFFLFLTVLEKRNINLFQFIGFLFCPVIFLKMLLLVLMSAFRIRTNIVLWIAFAGYAVLNILYLILGYRSESVLKNIGFVLLGLIIELILLFIFRRICNSYIFYIEVRKINIQNIESHNKLLPLKEFYDNKVREYNTISKSIVDSSEKLGMKKPKLKEKSEYSEHFKIPEIPYNELGIFYDHDPFDIDFFLDETKRYVKRVDSEIANLEHNCLKIDENSKMAFEVNRALNRAGDPQVSESSKKMFKRTAESFFHDLRKGNKSIKK